MGEEEGSWERELIKKEKGKTNRGPDVLKGLNHGCLKECQHFGIYVDLLGEKSRATTKKKLADYFPKGNGNYSLPNYPQLSLGYKYFRDIPKREKVPGEEGSDLQKRQHSEASQKGVLRRKFCKITDFCP